MEAADLTSIRPPANGRSSAELRAQAYDVVLNGTELGGGSIPVSSTHLDVYTRQSENIRRPAPA